MEINYAIRWIVIYPVDSAIRRLNNRGLEIKQTRNWVRSMVIYQVYVQE